MRSPVTASHDDPSRPAATSGRGSLLRVARSLLAACGIGLAFATAAAGLPADGRALTTAEQQAVLAQIESVGRRGFLYEVSRATTDAKPDAATPEATSADAATPKKLYLYGTIHLGRIGSEPFNGPMLKALGRSRRLALEADPTDTGSVQALALQLGQYPAGDSLQRHVSTALMARVRTFGDRLGLPADRVERFKPWLLANMVTLSDLGGAGLDPALGSELYLSGFARGLGMPIVEVEGLEAQMRLLAGLPDAMQSAQLEEALADVDREESRQQSKALFDLWLAGDVEAGDALVAELHRDAGDKPFERYFVETLIDRRNRTMADVAESCLDRPGNTFFAIGSLHLFGDAGLLREFARRGYRVVDLQPPLAARR